MERGLDRAFTVYCETDLHLLFSIIISATIVAEGSGRTQKCKSNKNQTNCVGEPERLCFECRHSINQDIYISHIT